MNSIALSVKKNTNKRIKYKNLEEEHDVVLGTDPNIDPTPYFEVPHPEKDGEKQINSISAPVWDEWQGKYYPCVSVKFHGDYKDESYYLQDVLNAQCGNKYLKYQWKNRSLFNPLLRRMNKQILKTQREKIKFVSFFFFFF